MKATLYEALRTPAGIVKRTLPFLMVGVFFMACNRDLLYSDDLLVPNTGNELLVFKYQAETTSFRNYANNKTDELRVETIPYRQNEKFELRISKGGQVEVFTEHLSPSENLFDQIDPNQPDEVKYEHFKNGKMTLYDINRKVVGEYDAPSIQKMYDGLYQDLINPEFKGITFFNLINVKDDLKRLEETNQVSQRVPQLQTPYDDHPAYKVYRTYIPAEENSPEMINEIIATSESGRVLFISGYDMNGEVFSRSKFAYEGDKLKGLVTESLDFSNPENPYKQKSITEYQNFEFNLNLD